jgi:hypothetical protein
MNQNKITEATTEDSKGTSGLLRKWQTAAPSSKSNLSILTHSGRTNPDTFVLQKVGVDLIPSSKGPKLGTGQFGTVYEGLWAGQRVAVKLTEDFNDYNAYTEVKRLRSSLDAVAQTCLPIVYHQEISSYPVDADKDDDFIPTIEGEDEEGKVCYVTIMEFLQPLHQSTLSYFSRINHVGKDLENLDQMVLDTFKSIQKSLPKHLRSAIQHACEKENVPQEIQELLVVRCQSMLPGIILNLDKVSRKPNPGKIVFGVDASPWSRIEDIFRIDCDAEKKFVIAIKDVMKATESSEVKLSIGAAQKLAYTISDRLIELCLRDTRLPIEPLKIPANYKGINKASTNTTQNKDVKRFILGLKQLSKVGILYHDAHSGNVMQRTNGEIVIVDVGFFEFS